MFSDLEIVLDIKCFYWFEINLSHTEKMMHRTIFPDTAHLEGLARYTGLKKNFIFK